jgi:pimeloyl-ACP methyl ester carboxylesterase
VSGQASIVTIREEHVPTPDGRTLRVLDYGDPTGAPVIYHHGTPGCARMRDVAVQDAAGRGLRMIAHDRPGYAGSTRLPDRRVGHVAADVVAVADHLGIDRFATMGVSGGGPHTLACAALLPDRVVACAAVASPAPYDAEDLDYFAGMGELNAEELDIIARGHEAYLDWLREQADQMLSATPDQLRESMQTLLSEPDRVALTGALAAFIHAQFSEAVAPGVEGWADESLGGYEPWGVDPETIRVPVGIWHGEQDRFVPAAHGRWLAAHITGAEAHFSPDDGHISMIEGSGGEVHAWLADQLGATRP